MALQPRNTKIMRREGPWGRAGWFRSRYLTLTDATAGRLERSRRHSAAEQPPQPATSPRLGRRRFRQAPATGSHPTRWEQGDLRVQPSQAGGWGGVWMQESGGRAAAGHGGGNRGLLRAPWPSGAAMCVRDTQSMLLCLCSYEAEGVCAREAKCECGCDRDEACTWVHVSLGSLNTPLPPSRATAMLVGASHAGARDGGVRRKPQAPRTTRFCHLQMEERWPCGLPGPPLSHTMVVLPGTVMCSGLDTTTLGTPVRGWGMSCWKGCWAGGGLTILSTGCIIKKSLRQVGGQSRV